MKRLTTLGVLLYCILLFPIAFADEDDDDEIEISNNIQKAEQLLDRAISLVPHNGTKEGLRVYRDVVFNNADYDNDIYVASSNSGIENYIENSLNENSCFREKTIQFLEEIKKLDSKYIDSTTPLSGRPSHLETAGSGNFNDLEPGFLWQIALRIADNNPNLAMRMIGVCGHDDELGSNTKEVSCPFDGSVLYLSKALGAKQDIPQTLRDDIIEKQAPTKGGAYLPSKNYHIMGSAFLSCLMIEKGVPGRIATFISKQSAGAYRTIRIDNQINLLLSNRTQNLAEFSEREDKSLSFSDYMKDIVEEPSTLTLYDAAYLFKTNNFGGGKLPNMHIKNFSIPLPKFLKSPINDGTEVWDDQRYTEAKRVYDSWMLDYKWTVEQHEIGSKFAAKNCKKAIVDTTFEKECSKNNANCNELQSTDAPIEETRDITSNILEILREGLEARSPF